jgi:hypothetical protein
MADERWEKLVEQQGISYAKTIAGSMNLKLETARNCAAQFSILSPGEKCQSKRDVVEIPKFGNVRPCRCASANQTCSTVSFLTLLL